MSRSSGQAMEIGTGRRINKREFISRAAKRSGLSIKTMSQAHQALMGELIDSVAGGDVVVLNGFGRFYRQDHKGHKVRFGKESVGDYSVLKFSASRSVNRSLDACHGVLDGITEVRREFAVV